MESHSKNTTELTSPYRYNWSISIHLISIYVTLRNVTTVSRSYIITEVYDKKQY
jgi:hypothetical protein